jgi:hypothetical protein
MHVSSRRGLVGVRYGTAMEIFEESVLVSEAGQSDSIDGIRDRIAAIQSKELDLHVAEYDAIHSELERALTGIDGL